MRTPSGNGLMGIGAGALAIGLTFVGVQGQDMGSNPHVGFFAAWGIAGIAVTAVGSVLVILGAFMRDGEEKKAPEPISPEGINVRQRIGIRMRGRSVFSGQNAHISNQDVSLDMDDDSRWDGNEPTID